jgi:hypothetical protein
MAEGMSGGRSVQSQALVDLAAIHLVVIALLKAYEPNRLCTTKITHIKPTNQAQ